MVKKLKPTMYHRTVCLFSKTSTQTAKVIEELQELREALDTKDRYKIMEELADVENVIPYILLIYTPKERVEIRYTGKYDYNLISRVTADILAMYSVHTYNAHLYTALKGMIKILAESLYNIYLDYELQPSEINEIIDVKRARTLGRKFKEMI